MRVTKFEIASRCLIMTVTLMFLRPAAAIDAADYAKSNDFENASLSPDGKYIAVDRPGDIRSTLIIVETATLKPLTEFSLPPHQSVYGAQWANKDTLVFSRTQRTGGLETPRIYGEVIAMSVDGKRTKYLYGALGDSSSLKNQLDEGWAQVINTLENDDENIIVLQTNWDKADELKTRPAIIKINVYSGKRDQLATSPINNPYVTFDLENKLRFVSGFDENINPVSYRYVETDNSWEKISGSGSELHSFLPMQFLPGNRDFLAKISEAGEANCLYLVKQDHSKEKLHCEDGVNVGILMHSSQPGLPLALLGNPTNPNITMLSFDTDDSRLYQAVSKSFPDDIVFFNDYSQDGKTVLFSVYSDSKPSRYYLYDRASNTSRLVFNSKATINTAVSGNSTGFSFKARDGLTIHGVLTLPANHVKGKTPMVVMPHGGPLYISDDWYFDRDVQWLAANGYAVLRVNFRGSAGYGETFVRKGYRTWGTEIQHDIIDATNFVVGTQTVDKDRVCITGGSFGAYSAMMSSILAPQTFRCTIGYAGVYDLSLMFKKGDIPDSKSGLQYLDMVLGKDKVALASQSPVSRAKELKIPVLLIHGSEDWRTPLPQAMRLQKALKEAGNTPEMLVVPNEGHGFVRDKNRTLYLTALKTFLDKHIGPKKAAAQ